MIHQCKCENVGQDKLHGKGNRVFNKLKKDKPGQDKYRCTVCKDVISKTYNKKEKETEKK